MSVINDDLLKHQQQLNEHINDVFRKRGVLTSGRITKAPVMMDRTMLIPNNQRRKMK